MDLDEENTNVTRRGRQIRKSSYFEDFCDCGIREPIERKYILENVSATVAELTYIILIYICSLYRYWQKC